MPDWETLYPGRFLKKVDLVEPRVIRITGVQLVELENDDGEKEDKVVIAYRDARGKGEIPWPKTNAKLTEVVLGEKDYQRWIGRLITIAHDPTIMFGKEQKGGIRVIGSPDMKERVKVELKRPRRKKREVYILGPTSMRGTPLTPAPASESLTEPVAEPVTEPDASEVLE